jgi:hypothetical protein
MILVECLTFGALLFCQIARSITRTRLCGEDARDNRNSVDAAASKVMDIHNLASVVVVTDLFEWKQPVANANRTKIRSNCFTSPGFYGCP